MFVEGLPQDVVRHRPRVRPVTLEEGAARAQNLRGDLGAAVVGWAVADRVRHARTDGARQHNRHAYVGADFEEVMLHRLGEREHGVLAGHVGR